ncbi:MAG: DUF6600 domain-containing protein, partial [Thermoanaerobaculia bacterium]
ALDRSTSVTFKSILDSYDGDAEQTIVELKYGHVAIERDDDTRQLLRLDTENASYAASDVALYAVEADSKNHDRVTVFDGAMEVRTPARTMRLREGEEAHVDDGGMYDLVNAHDTADEFERWFMQRASRSSTAKGRYLDNSLAYSEADLESNGAWYFAADFGGWAWCPRVANGWRPYYNGYWRHSPSGLLVWVSYDPWGWVPYHYGRWAFEPAKGWVWLPGAAYAPAWVYWMYGPSYIGWAPMGWYDCYRPYYNWAYRPFAHAGFIVGGWSGRIHPGEVDLRPWTFVTPDQLLKRHVDQAALPGESIRERMRRDGNTGLVSSAPARFGRNEIKDPNTAVGDIFKRGINGDTVNGRKGSGPPTDMTPYFRRDPDLSASVRERVVRSQPVQGAVIVPVAPAGGGALTGVPSPGTPGTLEGRANRGADGTNPRTESPVIPRDGRSVHEDPSAGVRGGNTTNGPANTTGNVNDWRRGRAVDGVTHRDGSQTPAVDTTHHDTPASGDVKPAPAPGNDQWRGRAVGHHQDSSPAPAAPPAGTNKRDLPRRIIDAIGGAHISRGQAPANDSKPREHSSGSGSSSGSSSPPPRAERPSSPPPSPPPAHSSPAPSSSSHDSGSHETKKN